MGLLPESSKFSERLRHWRLASGMTQQELGEAAGIHWVTISRLETGKAQPFIKTVRALCKVLSINRETLISPEEYAEARDRRSGPT